MVGALFEIQITGWTAMIIVQITGHRRAFPAEKRRKSSSGLYVFQRLHLD